MYHSKNDEEKLNTNHKKTRNKLRKIGPTCVILGLALIAYGLYGMFSGEIFDNTLMGFAPFVGMAILFVGAVTSMMGFGGAVARYQAGEMAPVAKDTVNYMADGTKDAVQTLAKSLGQGISEGMNAGANTDTQQPATCPKCKTENDHDAKFCDSCAQPLANTCTNCNHPNDPNARFCDNCGTPFHQS